MKLKSVKLYIFLSLMTLIALSGCGTSNNNNSNSQSPPAPAGGETIEITEHAINWEFSPLEIIANVGDTLKLTLNNDVGVHGLQIDDLDVKIMNGETATIKLDKAGTYDFYCNIQCGQGHDNMVGQIIVQ